VSNMRLARTAAERAGSSTGSRIPAANASCAPAWTMGARLYRSSPRVS
jgi:hypothetical protein